MRAVIDVVGISDVKAWGELDSVWARGPSRRSSAVPSGRAARSIARPSAYAPASIDTYLSPVSPPAFLAYATQDVLVPPAEQGRPLAMQWAAAIGRANVVYDESPTRATTSTGVGSTSPRLHDFIDGVLAGSIS